MEHFRLKQKFRVHIEKHRKMILWSLFFKFTFSFVEWPYKNKYFKFPQNSLLILHLCHGTKKLIKNETDRFNFHLVITYKKYSPINTINIKIITCKNKKSFSRFPTNVIFFRQTLRYLHVVTIEFAKDTNHLSIHDNNSAFVQIGKRFTNTG